MEVWRVHSDHREGCGRFVDVRKLRFDKVPVRYRLNVASSGLGYGRYFVAAVKKGYTRFDIISLNIH